MGKKKLRSSTTSSGSRRSVSKSTVSLVRRERDPGTDILNKVMAWRAGKDPWITVNGPSSNMQYIRVRANSVWGNPKKSSSVVIKED